MFNSRRILEKIVMFVGSAALIIKNTPKSDNPKIVMFLVALVVIVFALGLLCLIGLLYSLIWGFLSLFIIL